MITPFFFVVCAGLRIFYGKHTLLKCAGVRGDWTV